MILYADVLFMIDFSMDVIVLWAAGRITHSSLSVLRICIAAAISATVSVAATAVGLERAWNFILSAVLALTMCLISFGGGTVSAVVKKYIILWLGGILLGGVMTFLMSAGAMEAYSDALYARSSPIAVIPTGIVLLVILVRTFASTPKADHLYISLTFRGKTVKLRAMCDTGNLLEDPFTGESVIFVKNKELEMIFTLEEYEYLSSTAQIPPPSLLHRLRLIPARAVSGDTLIKAVRLDKVQLEKRNCGALVSLTDKIHGENFEAVISSKLI